MQSVRQDQVGEKQETCDIWWGSGGLIAKFGWMVLYGGELWNTGGRGGKEASQGTVTSPPSRSMVKGGLPESC